MTCFPPCLLSFLSHHNHCHDILKNTKKQRHFFKKKHNWKGKENKKKRKNAKSQFWLRITRKVDATGPDFGCKFRLRRSPGASKSGFGPITAPFLTIFCFFSLFLCCILMAFFEYGPFFRRFPFFAFGILTAFFHKIVASVSLMKHAL